MYNNDDKIIILNFLSCLCQRPLHPRDGNLFLKNVKVNNKKRTQRFDYNNDKLITAEVDSIKQIFNN